jgi:hypothetical protein
MMDMSLWQVGSTYRFSPPDPCAFCWSEESLAYAFVFLQSRQEDSTHRDSSLRSE